MICNWLQVGGQLGDGNGTEIDNRQEDAEFREEKILPRKRLKKVEKG